jgi:hypothetical protein
VSGSRSHPVTAPAATRRHGHATDHGRATAPMAKPPRPTRARNWSRPDTARGRPATAGPLPFPRNPYEPVGPAAESPEVSRRGPKRPPLPLSPPGKPGQPDRAGRWRLLEASRRGEEREREREMRQRQADASSKAPLAGCEDSQYVCPSRTHAENSSLIETRPGSSPRETPDNNAAERPGPQRTKDPTRLYVQITPLPPGETR